MQHGVAAYLQHMRRSGGGPDLCAGGLFMLLAPPLCAWLRGGLSSWQNGIAHDHKPEPRLTLGTTTHYFGSPCGSDTHRFERFEPGA